MKILLLLCFFQYGGPVFANPFFDLSFHGPEWDVVDSFCEEAPLEFADCNNGSDSVSGLGRLPNVTAQVIGRLALPGNGLTTEVIDQSIGASPFAGDSERAFLFAELAKFLAEITGSPVLESGLEIGAGTVYFHQFHIFRKNYTRNGHREDKYQCFHDLRSCRYLKYRTETPANQVICGENYPIFGDLNG